MHRRRQLLRRHGRDPRPVFGTARPDFSHEHQLIWVGMERLPAKFVGDVRPVEVAGVDVVDAQQLKRYLLSTRPSGLSISSKAACAVGQAGSSG